MATAITVHCNRCRKDVQYHFSPVNHAKQLLLTIITLGLWLPVWLCQVFGPTKVCNECGSPIWGED